ncbi:acyl-homoserine-lactone synthase [Paracoccus aestuariivivens]|uniref:acyl-homoserine-lactone synthase n=1 Tax=Paracoccus aestuariivivens TaxID=1820333 RepID=A0A6L6J9F3_9RHOB|nr:acyl-homoserine-lactone synthase [Paracoccus aestuariivivens]MTH77775.1 N-acyl-L-homoserine lactone synthetase [Paracoccus aestuariivivens]
MQTTTLSFANLHNHGELFANIFRARKQSFIIQKRWDLPQTDDMEFDQYDTPMSRWVAIHEKGTVLAGVRLTPTTARCGMYTYMIRDAQQDLLGGSIPQNLLDEPAPVEATTWEASRLFVDHSTPQSGRRRVHMSLLREMTHSARELGATKLVCLVAATWPRWLRAIGLDAHAMGPVIWIDDAYFQCVSINLAAKMH